MRDVVRAFKALGDESRIRVLKMLEVKTLCVCEIAEVLGLALSTVSRHLKVLEDNGLVHRAKDGLWVEYSLASPDTGTPARDLLDMICGMMTDDPIVREDRGKAIRADRELIRERV